MIDFINEKRLCGAMASDGRLRIQTIQEFEKTFRISEKSRNNHRTLAQLLGCLTLAQLLECLTLAQLLGCLTVKFSG